MFLAQLQIKQEEPAQTRKQESTWLYKRMHWILELNHTLRERYKYQVLVQPAYSLTQIYLYQNKKLNCNENWSEKKEVWLLSTISFTHQVIWSLTRNFSLRVL